MNFGKRFKSALDVFVEEKIHHSRSVGPSKPTTVKLRVSETTNKMQKRARKIWKGLLKK